jgi:hypothetical protein
MLKWALKKQDMRVGSLDVSGSVILFCERGNIFPLHERRKISLCAELSVARECL